MRVTAYATAGPKLPFERVTIDRRDLGPKDVLIKIAFSGICHSDIHTAWGEWGDTIYPLVPGHEIAGTVEAIGSAVTKHGNGDRVGVGVLVDTCRVCTNCHNGYEQYCTGGAIETYGSIGRDGRPTEGGYSTHIVVDEEFVVRVPNGMGLDIAAPLMCAGITLYSPLRHWHAGPGRQVAIVGLGGLGHLGVKMAHAMGADVTVLSHTLAKQADGLRMGADRYYATSDPATFDVLKGSFDLVINTVSTPVALDTYLSLLRMDGTMVMVGLPPEAMPVHAGALIDGRRCLTASAIGSLAETQEMLDFCASHGLGAEVEVIDARQIDAAWERVVGSDVRYRFVIAF